jgi:hypothetical protein
MAHKSYDNLFLEKPDNKENKHKEQRPGQGMPHRSLSQRTFLIQQTPHSQRCQRRAQQKTLTLLKEGDDILL